MPYKYIGKPTTFVGKTLWELLGNLKNFGVGRIVVRSSFERYPEPCYMKIVKVDTLAEPEKPSADAVRKVKVLVEKTFRGIKADNPILLETTTYKTDYKLIAKDEEAQYCRFELAAGITEKIMPRTTKFPPLLRELLLRELKENSDIGVKEPELEIVYMRSQSSKYRIAVEGEKPTEELAVGLGNPISPKLYKTVKL